MPAYKQPGAELVRQVPAASPGFPVYLLGSYNQDVAPTRMQITSVALASPTATVVGTVIEGQIPVTGQLVTIRGAVPSYFNVTNAKILSVSAAATPDVGVYTITFSLTNSNIGTTTSPGLAVAPQIETGETLVVGTSQQCGLPDNTGPDNGRTVRFDVTFPTMPGSATVVAQTAALDIDSEYSTLGTVTSVTAGVQSTQSTIFTGVRGLFVRLKVTAAAGGGTIIGKVLA